MEAISVLLRKEVISNKALCRLFGVAAFIILTALGAFVRLPLPFTPVPLTLQTFFVLLCGAFLGAGLGATAQFSYVLLGIAGLPLFTAAGSGPFYLFGPTAGYLWGFILAALCVGRFIGYARNNALFTIGLFCFGDAIILSCGTLWLKFLFGLSFSKSLLMGFMPFIPGDFLKALAAAGIYLRLKSRLEKIF